jgi:hypothetical protein
MQSGLEQGLEEGKNRPTFTTCTYRGMFQRRNTDENN